MRHSAAELCARRQTPAYCKHAAPDLLQVGQERRQRQFSFIQHEMIDMANRSALPVKSGPPATTFTPARLQRAMSWQRLLLHDHGAQQDNIGPRQIVVIEVVTLRSISRLFNPPVASPPREKTSGGVAARFRMNAGRT